MKPVIDCMRDFVMTFPELKDGCLTVDYLSDKAVEYCVEAVPCAPFARKYVDGSGVRQFLFIFASREFYSADVNQNIENSAFYEKFENWILKTDAETLYPFLDGRQPVSLDLLSGQYVPDADFGSARYQIQLRLLYEEE